VGFMELKSLFIKELLFFGELLRFSILQGLLLPLPILNEHVVTAISLSPCIS
jgi:hypothetical protein